LRFYFGSLSVSEFTAHDQNCAYIYLIKSQPLRLVVALSRIALAIIYQLYKTKKILHYMEKEQPKHSSNYTEKKKKVIQVCKEMRVSK